MRCRTETTGVEVPFEGFPAHSEFIYAGIEFLQRGLPFRTADDFADFREEHIHSPDGLAVFVLFHIEGLDVLRIVSEDDRAAEMLLHEIALVLGLQVHSPIYREFEFLSALLKYLDTFGVGEPYEIGLDN